MYSPPGSAAISWEKREFGWCITTFFSGSCSGSDIAFHARRCAIVVRQEGNSGGTTGRTNAQMCPCTDSIDEYWLLPALVFQTSAVAASRVPLYLCRWWQESVRRTGLVLVLMICPPWQSMFETELMSPLRALAHRSGSSTHNRRLRQEKCIG
jgi:hypothetical protein